VYHFAMQRIQAGEDDDADAEDALQVGNFAPDQVADGAAEYDRQVLQRGNSAECQMLVAQWK